MFFELLQVCSESLLVLFKLWFYNWGGEELWNVPTIALLFFFSPKHNMLPTNTAHYEIHNYLWVFFFYDSKLLYAPCYTVSDCLAYSRTDKLFVITSRLSYISAKLEITWKCFCGLKNSGIFHCKYHRVNSYLLNIQKSFIILICFQIVLYVLLFLEFLCHRFVWNSVISCSDINHHSHPKTLFHFFPALASCFHAAPFFVLTQTLMQLH